MALLPPTFDWIQSVVRIQNPFPAGYETVDSVTTDTTGNVYICGSTSSTSINLAGITFTVPVLPNPNGQVSYIASFNPLGVFLWLRWITGTVNAPNPPAGQSVSSNKITTDSTGNVYVVGQTSLDTILIYDTSGAVLATYTDSAILPPGITNAGFLFSINSTGTPQWFKFFDSSADDENVVSVTVDTSDNVYVCSLGTNTPQLYIINGTGGVTTFTSPGTGNTTSFVAKFNSSGTLGLSNQIRWIDGSSSDQGNEITSDSSGNVYVTGNSASQIVTIYTGPPIGIGPPTPILSYTNSTPIPPGPDDAAFLLKLDSAGAPQWFLFFDGAQSENGYSVSTIGGFAYVTGRSDSTSLEIVNGGTSLSIPYTNPMIGSDAAFVVKINTSTAVPQWLRWIDGPLTQQTTEITSDSTGAYVIGRTNSPYLDIYNETGGTEATYPVPPPPVPLGGTEMFALKFDSSGDPQWIVWIASNGTDIGTGINVDSNNNIYITGNTDKPSIFLRGYDPALFLSQNYTAADTTPWGFVFKLRQALAPLPPSNPVCYAKGTIIATDRGLLPIEDIKLSDKVRTYGCIKENMFEPVHGVPIKTLTRVEDTRIKNRFANIKFIGHFTVDAMHGNTAPICITAGALGDAKPERDLFVSPNHSILIGDHLVFAKDLINEINIYQDMSFENIEYYHILCDNHYIINANGTLSETLGSEDLKLFETMIYAQSKVYESLGLENKFQLQDIAT